MRVVIADDSLLVREGLARLLSDNGVEVVATADNAVLLAQAVATSRPDAAIVDIRMPPTHTDEGLAAAGELRVSYPDLGILVLSQYLESDYALTLLSDAPDHIGYLIKDRVSHLGVLVDASERVVVGECVIDPTIVTTLLRRPREKGPADMLTERELAVLAVMAEGRSNQAIAARGGVSEKTVEANVRQIFQKLDIREAPRTTAGCSPC